MLDEVLQEGTIFEGETLDGRIVAGTHLRDEGLYSWIGDGKGRETKVYPDSIRILTTNATE